MAGIGFELKKLFRDGGILSTLRAYGYAGVVCTGPMLLGIVLQMGVLALSGAWGVARDSQDLFVCMVTYSLLASLVFSSFFSLVVTRYLADMLFSGRDGAVLPSFWGSNAVMLAAGCPLYGLFLAVSCATLVQGILCLALFAEMVANWNAMSYLTAIKDYRGILRSFAAAVVVALGSAALVLAAGLPPVESLLASVFAGYGVMLVWNTVLLYRVFPETGESPWRFLAWIDRYRPLAFIGALTNIGLFAHLVIVWASPIGVQVRGLFYGAPYYDIAALLAFLTALVTTVNFVVSVEVNFYPSYRRYYGLYNEGGTAGDIAAAESEMLSVLARELRYCAIKQLFACTVAVSLGPVLLGLVPLGFNDLMHGYFRTLCVGYGLYAVGNAVMLILLYFADYRGAFRATAAFAALSACFTLASLSFDQTFYGFGFVAASAVFFALCTLRLARFTSNLPYRILSRGPIVEHARPGAFTKLAFMLERGTFR